MKRIGVKSVHLKASCWSQIYSNGTHGASTVDHKNGNGNGSNGGNGQIDKLIKMGQAEKFLGAVLSPVPTRPTLISFVKKGILHGTRIGNNYYIYESSLREFLEKYRGNL